MPLAIRKEQAWYMTGGKGAEEKDNHFTVGMKRLLLGCQMICLISFFISKN